MSIEQIRIRNYRSLREVIVNASALTVLVGCNDEGKSNVLRALDLFFNSEQRDGYVLNWERDFSGFAKISRNKAPQIEITLTFKLPDSFNLEQSVMWRRIWRQNDGLHLDSISLPDGNDLPSRSKAYAYLKTLRYEYVPAIKGPDYFSRLLGSMHDMLDATVQKDIHNAATSFTTEIRRYTKGILSDLEEQLGLKSDIELPSDLRQLFSELEFRSTVGAHSVGLSQRGDGIKVRHIPVILKWLATQANHLSAPGKPRVATIWGYEEPENNLETRKCFELAEFFVTTSPSIQTFLTTHSPVFYSVFQGAENDIGLIEVQLDPQDGTCLTPRAAGQPSDVDALHSSIGFLDLLEPHVREWKQRVDRLQRRLEEGISLKHPTIFVEGPSDKLILSEAFRRFFPNLSEVKILCSPRNGGGHAWVKDSLIAWHHSRPEHKAVGLFDGDAASQQSITEFDEIVESRVRSKPRALKLRLKAQGMALQIMKARLALPVAIEELCPREAWAKAEASNWLEDRPGLPALYGFSETDVTFNQWLAERLPDEELRLVAAKRVSDEHKENFSKFVANSIGDGDCEYDFDPLRKLALQLVEKLGIHVSEEA